MFGCRVYLWRMYDSHKKNIYFFLNGNDRLSFELVTRCDRKGVFCNEWLNPSKTLVFKFEKLSRAEGVLHLLCP